MAESQAPTGRADDPEARREMATPSHKWSPEDKRLLLITFAGGLAANLAAVLIVGMAIALDKQRGKPTTSVPLDIVGIIVGALVLCLPIGAVTWIIMRPRDAIRAILVGLGGVACLFGIFWLLTLLGEAAGIK
jgi:hypothetical protein